MITKEERKQYIEISKEIQKTLNSLSDLKLKRRVLKMVGNNPFIEIRVNNWETDEINNDILKTICETLKMSPSNLNKIVYGNISNKIITLYLREWLLVMEALK